MEKIFNKKFTLIFVVGCLLTGCGNVPASSTPALVETPTKALSTPTSTLALTSTPPRTATEMPATPTVTPEPGLQTKGPYFAYFQQSNLILRWVLVDADGRGRKVVELPRAISDAYAYGTLSAPDIRF